MMKKAFFTVLASLAVFAMGAGSVFACTTNGNYYGYGSGYYSNNNGYNYNNYNYTNTPCNNGVNYNNYQPIVYSAPVYTTSPATLYPNNYVYGYNYNYDNGYTYGNSGTTYSVSYVNGNYDGYNGYNNYNNGYNYNYNGYNNYNNGYNNYDYNNNYNGYSDSHRRQTCVSCHVKSDPRCKICYR